MSRQCDATGCTTDTASGRFMCIKHWRMVPVDVQRTISARYRAGRKGFAFLVDLAYLSACDGAIERIALAEGMPDVDNSYARLLRGLRRRVLVAVIIDDAVEHTRGPV